MSYVDRAQGRYGLSLRRVGRWKDQSRTGRFVPDGARRPGALPRWRDLVHEDRPAAGVMAPVPVAAARPAPDARRHALRRHDRSWGPVATPSALPPRAGLRPRAPARSDLRNVGRSRLRTERFGRHGQGQGAVADQLEPGLGEPAGRRRRQAGRLLPLRVGRGGLLHGRRPIPPLTQQGAGRRQETHAGGRPVRLADRWAQGVQGEVQGDRLRQHAPPQGTGGASTPSRAAGSSTPYASTRSRACCISRATSTSRWFGSTPSPSGSVIRWWR